MNAKLKVRQPLAKVEVILPVRRIAPGSKSMADWSKTS